MRRKLTILALAMLSSSPAVASAEPLAAPAGTPSSASAAPTNVPMGLAVVALPGATDAAWPLAQLLYAEPTLRPAGIDDAHARVLCGEEAPPDAAGDLRDLAETIAALRGEDAATRILLGQVARRLSVRALIVVRVEAGRPVAQAFMPDMDAFDAATYAPDDTASPPWLPAVRSLKHTFGPDPRDTQRLVAAPPLATREGPRIQNPPRGHIAFYESGWFWGALATAAFAGGAVYFASRDSGSPAIHLEMQVPH